jgi:hypothetical protein
MIKWKMVVELLMVSNPTQPLGSSGKNPMSFGRVLTRSFHNLFPELKRVSFDNRANGISL